MSRILIPTQLDDVHAISVAMALERRGHEVALWHGSDYPSRQVSSISVSGGAGLQWNIEGPGIGIENTPFDVVWLRRPAQPVLPADSELHPGDRQIAERECGRYYGSIWQVIAPDAFWVNPLSARNRSISKPVQLLEAVRSGLSIPETLCSNDPDRMRAFLKASPGKTIYKTFAPAQWRTADGGVAMGFTNTVTVDDLPDDEILRLCPGILQHEVAKDHELRVTYMGHHAVVAKLLSQQSATGQTDYRAAFSGIGIEPSTLPEEVDRACRALMERLGLVFGCFDLIVTPEGEHVFIEVNEMGQFLWIEEICPELLTLDPFCAFLESRRPDFTWQPGDSPLRFVDLADEVEARRKEDAALHVERPRTELAHDDPSGEGAAESSGTVSDWCETCQGEHDPNHPHHHHHHHHHHHDHDAPPS